MGKNKGCCGCFTGCFLTIFGFFVLVAVLCGGSYFWVMSNEPKPLIENFTPSASLAQTFENKVNTAANNARTSRQFGLRVSQAEAASWLNLKAPDISTEEFALDNIQVKFQGNKALIYGEFDALGMQDVGTLVEVALDFSYPDGQLIVNISDAQVGGIGVPASWQQEISDQIKQTIDQELQKISGRYRITSLSVADGWLNINGTVQ